MRGIDIEEGEACFVQDYKDDDENIDPDRDFSYIDRKLENVLGHYQKDFIGGVSAESLGARYGGYGSFLPVQQRSPPILSNQAKETQVNSKSPQNPPSEQFFQNPTVTGNNSLPARTVPASSGQEMHARSESGISLRNNQLRLESSKECASNGLPNKPVTQLSEQNSLKIRVKVASGSVLTRDISAIYSGLGLDMSPSSSPSSPEDSPAEKFPENNGTSRGLQELKAESPSFIVKVMTSCPLSNEALLSPLHDDLVNLMEGKNNVQPAFPGTTDAKPLNIVHGSVYLGGKKERTEEREPKHMDAKIDMKAKQKEASKERKFNQKIQKQKHVETVNELPAHITDWNAARREGIGTSMAKDCVISTSGDARSEETGKNSGSWHPVLLDKKSETGWLVEGTDNYNKQEQLAGHKMKEEFGSALSDAVIAEGGKTEKDKSMISAPKSELGVERRIGTGHRENEVNNILKQHPTGVDKVKEEVLDSASMKEASVCRKENGMREKIPKEKVVGFVSTKDVKVNDKQHVDPQETKDHDAKPFESSKQRPQTRAVPNIHKGLEEPSTYVANKISKDFQIDDVSSVEPRGSHVVNPGAENLEVRRSNIQSRGKRGDIELQREMRKDSKALVNQNVSKQRKEASSRDFPAEVCDREKQPSARKVMEQSGSRRAGFTSNNGPRLKGGPADDNCLTGKVPTGELPPQELASLMPLEMDDWVECDDCGKWRLLPFGMGLNALPKIWNCGMLTWLPGMNKCSVSEDETTNALRALYALPAPVPPIQVQGDQQAYGDGSASANALSGTQSTGLSSLGTGTDILASRGKKKNLAKPEVDATGLSGIQDPNRYIKKDQQHSVGIRNSKNLIKLTQEAGATRKSAAGDDRPSKTAKKRMAESEVSTIHKKMKVRRQVLENPDFAAQLPGESKVKIQNFNPVSVQTQSMRGSPEYPQFKVKDKPCSAMTTKDDFRKRKKSKDQHRVVIAAEEPSGKVQPPLNNLVARRNSGSGQRKEKKSSASNFEARVSSAEKVHHGTQGDGHKLNSDYSGSNSQHKKGRKQDVPLEQLNTDRISQKRAYMRKSSERAPDLGLSDNATTSSSSKVSGKVKAEAHEVKCSPVGSISSSPLKICKSGPEKRMNKVLVSQDSEDMSSRKRLNSRVDGACAPNEYVAHNEDIRDRKSKLFRTSGVKSGAAVEDHVAKRSSLGRHPSACSIDALPKHDTYESAGGKLDRRNHEAKLIALQRNPELQASNGLHFDGSTSDRDKLNFSGIGGEKESSLCTRAATEFEKGSGSTSVRNDNGSGKLSRQVVEDHVSLRHPHHTDHVSKDIEASSSKKNDSFHWAAKTALKEAKDLKHSAYRLKTAGSGLESTGIFFQAALKCLHGASLLEPGSNESGMLGEMSSTEVYSTTAKLCEDCAVEYEKCNDMASASLAYKCMEVAYMRVVYYNDVAASRDRLELQMAARAAPQVESPSSSASDVDNLNNQAAIDAVRDGHSVMDACNHVISSGNRANFGRLLNFTHYINLAMEASRRSLSSFAAANPILSQAGNEEGISCIKRVLDFSFHDVDGLLHLVRLAMEALNI